MIPIGIYESCKKIIGHSSLSLALIFFGRMIIAMAVVSIITGASIWEAGAVSNLPAINSHGSSYYTKYINQ